VLLGSKEQTQTFNHKQQTPAQSLGPHFAGSLVKGCADRVYICLDTQTISK
jgi:hypothetical protein